MKQIKAIARQEGSRGQRHHVHLLPDRDTTTMLGSRGGETVALGVQARLMQSDGYLS
jgi:RNA:NAD 2'-phosphotransferase (TPT1/KptA family)